MKHEQIPITPPTRNCWCGAKAHVIDWDYKMMYRVMCDNNHTLTKECGTKHRAIYRWNNRVLEKIKKMNLKERMSNLIDSVRRKEDREQLEWLLSNAWINMQVADYPEVHQAYVTVICELVPLSRIEEAKAILAKAWEDTKEQRERSLKP